MSTLQTGVVIRFDDARGFGFIRSDQDGAELFAHFSELAGTGHRSLVAGQQVEFTATEGPKGLRASGIRTL